MLEVEPIPASLWGLNVRTLLPSLWPSLRRTCYRAAGYKCEVCNGVGIKPPVECHEVWQYDDKRHVVTLIRLVALCPSCHEVKHIGLAASKGRYSHALKHLMRVNRWSYTTATRHIDNALLLCERRNAHCWTIDLSLVKPRIISRLI